MKDRINTLRTALTISFIMLLLVTIMNIQTVSLLPSALAAAVDVTTDRTSYLVGEVVTISGHAIPNSLVGLQVSNPNGTIILLVGVKANSSAIYSRTFRIPADAVNGTYTVFADGKACTFQVIKKTVTTTTTVATTTVTTTATTHTVTATVTTTSTETATVTQPPVTATVTTTSLLPTTTTATVTQPAVLVTSSVTSTATVTATKTAPVFVTSTTTTEHLTTVTVTEQVSLLGSPFLISGVVVAIVLVGIAAFLAGRRK